MYPSESTKYVSSKHSNPAQTIARKQMADVYRLMRKDGKGSLARLLFKINQKIIKEMNAKIWGL